MARFVRHPSVNSPIFAAELATFGDVRFDPEPIRGSEPFLYFRTARPKIRSRPKAKARPQSKANVARAATIEILWNTLRAAKAIGGAA